MEEEIELNFDLNFELSDEEENQPEIVNRFENLTEEDIERIANERNEPATVYNTKWGVRIFKGEDSLETVTLDFWAYY